MDNMKINEVTPAYLTDQAPVKERSVSDEFSFTLKTDELTGLITDIETLGKKLSEHMDIRDMKKYRGLISDFINEVVTNSHSFERENFLDRRGRHRVYGIVKLVNKGLDDLAQELLKEEKNPLAILEKTGEIQGLLLDIIL